METLPLTAEQRYASYIARCQKLRMTPINSERWMRSDASRQRMTARKRKAICTDCVIGRHCKGSECSCICGLKHLFRDVA
jgi:hypothetical protein